MVKRWFLIIARLSLGSLALIAIAVQAVSLGQAGVLNPVNYLSYFTNDSNIFAAIVLIISALYLIRRRRPSVKDDVIRGASVLYMAVTGVVYTTLLSGVEVGLQLAWVNILLHYIMPVAVVLDWLYQPQGTKLTFRQTWIWLLFPTAWLVYSLIRGSLTGWYAYPFLNPTLTGGYSGVLLYCLGILVAFCLMGWLLMSLGNRLKRNIT